MATPPVKPDDNQDAKPADVAPKPTTADGIYGVNQRLTELAKKIDALSINQKDVAFPGADAVEKQAADNATPPDADAAKARFNSRISINDVDAVAKAEAATSIQGLMKFFHDPKTVGDFIDKKVLMGAVTVSIMPGWRTKKDFAGEISVRASYDWNEARRTTVERIIMDDKIPERIRHRLAVDYGFPWSGGEGIPKIKVYELPAELRTALTLREMEGLSYEEIAQMMNCPIGTVRSRIFRAREAVAEKLRPLLGTSIDRRW